MLHPLLARERQSVISFLADAVASVGSLLPLIEQDADIEALHQFRVSIRRIRATLKALGDDLPVADALQLEAECRWLAGRGSGLRDFDVFLHRLEEEYLPALQGTGAAALRRLHRELGRERSRQRRMLLGSFRSKRAHALVDTLQALAALSVHTPGWAEAPRAGPALWRSYRRVIRQGREITEASPPEALHELRKRCKRLRYLLELYSGAYSDPEFRSTGRRLRKLQDVLGDYQDFDTHAAVLRAMRDAEAVAAAPDQPYLDLLDALLEVLMARAARTRTKFHARFSRFAAPEHHKRRRTLFRNAPRLPRPAVASGGYCHGMQDGAIVPLPVGKIVCVGRNYAEHAAELGNPVPQRPLLFIKPASAATDFGPFVLIPEGRGSVHHELEIAVLIGRELRSASPEEAVDAVAGVGLALDLTLRDLQDELKRAGHPWEIAKAFDGACPLSPFVPFDPAKALAGMRLRLSVNGKRRQFGSSAEMITPIVELICHASRQFSLWPGDVLLTGTPKGVGPLLPGDRLSAELAGLLGVRAEVVARPASRATPEEGAQAPS